MKRTNIYLEEEQTQLLDKRAADEGVSRAEVIRRILNEALAATDQTLARDLAAMDIAFGSAVDIDMPRREPGAREAHLEALRNA